MLACSPSDSSGTDSGGADGARETVVLVVLDSVSNALLAGVEGDAERVRTPRLAQFAEASIRYERHLAVSTGTQAAMASVLTGALPAEHGLASLRLRGRGRLDPRIETHAERFREAGFATLAAVALPQLRSELTGLLRGFEQVFEPELHVRAAWTGSDLWTRFGPALEAELRSDRSLFALVVLGDGRAHLRRSSRPSAEVLRRHMAPFEEQDRRVRDALELVDEDPFLALEELDRILGRSRGSAAFRALQAARHDAVLASLDVGFGRLLDLLEQTGRADRATVCVIGGALAESDGSYELDGMWTPCLLRLRGAREPERVTELVQVPRVFSRVLEAHGIPGHALGSGAAVCSLRDRNAGVALAPPFGMEQDPLGARRLFRLDGTEPVEASQHPEVQELTAALDNSLLRPTWSVVSGLDAPLDVGWTFPAGGGCALTPAPSGTPAFEPRGGGSLGGSEPVLEWLGSAPDLPLRLWFEGETLARDGVASIAFGSRSVDELPTLWLPIARRSESGDGLGEASGEEPGEDSGGDGPAPRVEIEHEGGGWWNLTVHAAEGSPVRALLALVPPEDLDRELALRPGDGDARIEGVPGRFDARWVIGSAPLAVRFKKEPAGQLGLHVSVDGQHLTPWQLHQGGRAFASRERVALYLPDWLPGLTDALDETSDESSPTAGRVSIHRSPSGSPSAPERTPFDRAQLSFARRLGENE